MLISQANKMKSEGPRNGGLIKMTDDGMNYGLVGREKRTCSGGRNTGLKVIVGIGVLAEVT